MQVKNHILFYSENEAKAYKNGNNIPKKKFYEARPIEENVHKKNYTFLNEKGHPYQVSKRFVTQIGLVNRKEKRNRRKASNKKGHLLEFHHKEKDKRRRLRKENKGKI